MTEKNWKSLIEKKAKFSPFKFNLKDLTNINYKL